MNISFLLKYPLMIIVLICGGASSYEDNTRNANKQPPQQNFAYAKLFAFTDDGKIYRLEKRETNGLPTDLFAFKEPSYKGEFAFALVKRSSGFAKRSVPKDLEWEENEQGIASPNSEFSHSRALRMPSFAFY